jgi:hypothetical protein
MEHNKCPEISTNYSSRSNEAGIKKQQYCNFGLRLPEIPLAKAAGKNNV